MRKYTVYLVLLFVFLISTIPQSASAAQRMRCFVETGFCITGAIREYWERNGGLAVFGYPISSMSYQTIEATWSGPIQWFERDRLEDHSNEDKGVMAGRLGALYLEERQSGWRPGNIYVETPGCRVFAETKYAVCGSFLRYWERNGGLERFGLPLTDLVQEQIEGKSYTVQYFERRRMELHPEFAGTDYEIQLGLLGSMLYSNPRPTQEQLAIDTLNNFFYFLNSGDYVQAAALYAGSYEQLREYNPDIQGRVDDPTVQAQLLQRACEVNGFLCLNVRRVLLVEPTTQGYTIYVEFIAPRGGIYIPPDNGQHWFIYSVKQMAGQFMLIELPPYSE